METYITIILALTALFFIIYDIIGILKEKKEFKNLVITKNIEVGKYYAINNNEAQLVRIDYKNLRFILRASCGNFEYSLTHEQFKNFI